MHEAPLKSSSIADEHLILLAGIPATGKSHFCRWLSAQHGYVHVDIEKADFRHSLGLCHVWDIMESSGDALPLITALRRLGPRVILDWGFPPHCLPIVTTLKNNGANLWWFDGDYDKARHEFIKRNTVALASFDHQINQIRQSWNKISAVFEGRCMNVLDANGQRMLSEAIWASMNQAN